MPCSWMSSPIISPSSDTRNTPSALTAYIIRAARLPVHRGYLAAVRPREAVDDREAEAGPPGRRAVAAVKDPKDVRHVRRGNAPALVEHRERQAAAGAPRAHHDPRPGGAVDGGVEQEIAERLFEQRLVRFHHRQVFIGLDGDGASLEAVVGQAHGGLNQLFDVAPVERGMHDFRLEAAHVEQVVDHAAEPPEPLLRRLNQGRQRSSGPSSFPSASTPAWTADSGVFSSCETLCSSGRWNRS